MKCPVCGKQFTVLWPDLWRYKRGRHYLCGYGCMRMIDRGETIMDKFTKEQKAKAVEIALEGGDPKAYLESIGSKNPENLWYYIKTQLRKNDPETWEKLAGSPKRAPVETPESEFVPAGKPKPLDGGEWEKLETPEAPKRAPLQYDGYTVCCIESKTFGRFYWDRDHNHLDWTTAEGEEVSFTPTGWKMFLEELPKVAEILGVEL